MTSAAPGPGGPWTSRSEEETVRAGEALAAALRNGDLIALTGPLGAGKSRLVHGIARGLASPAQVRSPTFTLVNEYAGRLALYHVDLYRVDAAEVEGLGLDECLDRGAVVVEWGEKLPARFLQEALLLTLTPGEGDRRIFEAQAEAGSRGAELLLAWQAVTGARVAPRG